MFLLILLTSLNLRTNNIKNLKTNFSFCKNKSFLKVIVIGELFSNWTQVKIKSTVMRVVGSRVYPARWGGSGLEARGSAPATALQCSPYRFFLFSFLPARCYAPPKADTHFRLFYPPPFQLHVERNFFFL